MNYKKRQDADFALLSISIVPLTFTPLLRVKVYPVSIWLPICRDNSSQPEKGRF